MDRQDRSEAGRLFAALAAVLVLALAAAGFVLLQGWGTTATAASLDEDTCRGWTASCASVEVRSDGDRLLLFEPNAVPDRSRPALPEAGGTARESSERLRVLAADANGACDSRTGEGCEDLTAAWTEAARSLDAGHMTGAPLSATPSDDEELSCREEAHRLAAEGKTSAEEQPECGRLPLAALFVVSLPTALYTLGPDGSSPIVETLDDGSPIGDAPAPGPLADGDTGQGGDDGDSDAGDEGTDDGADGDGDDSVGDGSDTGGEGDSGTETGSGGGTVGDDGSGGTPGDAGQPGGGGLPGGPGGGTDLPPVSEVPEPISTTLFGLGLAGYAGARLRKRRLGTAGEEPG